MKPSAEVVQVHDTVTIQALRADTTCYRWWAARIEAMHDTCIVTFTPPATKVEGITGGWIQHYAIRAFYWTDRRYNLLEVYRADGELEELYIHIASPATLTGTTLHYIDYELDVVMMPGEHPRIVDEDEFAEACRRYGYSLELQAACYAAVYEAVELAQTWTIRGWQPLP